MIGRSLSLDDGGWVDVDGGGGWGVVGGVGFGDRGWGIGDGGWGWLEWKTHHRRFLDNDVCMC